MHRIKGDAAALGLDSVEFRAHAFEDMLKDLRDRPQLSGSEFLPLVVSLDEMLGHLQSIRELVGRADALRATALLTARTAAGSARNIVAQRGQAGPDGCPGRAGPAHRCGSRQEGTTGRDGPRRRARRPAQDDA